MDARFNDIPNRPLWAILAAVALATFLFGGLYWGGHERTQEDKRRCTGTAVPHDIATSPQYIQSVQSCIEFARESRWGPWGVWRRDND
jgi:hypothetical protein